VWVWMNLLVGGWKFLVSLVIVSLVLVMCVYLFVWLLLCSRVFYIGRVMLCFMLMLECIVLMRWLI